MYKTSHEKRETAIEGGPIEEFSPLGLCQAPLFQCFCCCYEQKSNAARKKPQRLKPKTRGVRSLPVSYLPPARPLGPSFRLIGPETAVGWAPGGWKGAKQGDGYSGDEVKDRTNIGPTLVSPEGRRTECH
jgi:hypothetical protein